MKEKILFIGTSFLGAIKDGWCKINNDRWDSSFLGMNAPNFLLHLSSGWKVKDNTLKFDESFECFFSDPATSNDRPSNNKTFTGSARVKGLSIDLTRFDAIVFVDMFYRIRARIIVDENRTLKYDGIPVSDSLIRQLRINGFNGWAQQVAPSVSDEECFINSCDFIVAIKNSSRNATTHLITAPRPPSGQVDLKKIYGNIKVAETSLNFVEDFYTNSLAELGISYVRQPLAVLDQEKCLTDRSFSRGEHPTRSGLLDEHMNVTYGEIISAALETELKI